jgi:hypothetical protein
MLGGRRSGLRQVLVQIQWVSHGGAGSGSHSGVAAVAAVESFPPSTNAVVVVLLSAPVSPSGTCERLSETLTLANPVDRPCTRRSVLSSFHSMTCGIIYLLGRTGVFIDWWGGLVVVLKLIFSPAFSHHALRIMGLLKKDVSFSAMNQRIFFLVAFFSDMAGWGSALLC